MERYITVDDAMRELEKEFSPTFYYKIVRAIRRTRPADAVSREAYHRLLEQYESLREEFYIVSDELECIRFCDHMKGKDGVEHDA